MARVVVGSLLLTMAQPPREVAPAVEAAMDREELALREHLTWWEHAIRPAQPSLAQHLMRLIGPDGNLAVPATGTAEEGKSRAAAAPGPTGGQPGPTGGQPPEMMDEDGVEEESDEGRKVGGCRRRQRSE
jgi:hypothetical protein